MSEVTAIPAPVNGPVSDVRVYYATVNIDFDNFLKMAQGQLDPMQAFMSGKLKVAGDMSAALKLQSILGKMR